VGGWKHRVQAENDPSAVYAVAKTGKTVAREEATKDHDGDGLYDTADALPAPAPPSPEPTGSGFSAMKKVDESAPAKAQSAPPPPPPPGPPPREAPNTTPGAGHGAPGTGAAAAASAPTATAEARDTSMLVFTAQVTLAVYQVEQGVLAVEKIAREAGGYLAVKQDKRITIRVPRNRFEAALGAVDKIGDVLHRDVEAVDVTDEYVDMEIRIKNARAMQTRLKQLLEKASVKEAIEIEKEMRRVTEELELLEGKLKLLKDKIAYSTITVVFQARGSSMASSRVQLPFPWLSALGLPTLLRLQENK